MVDGFPEKSALELCFQFVLHLSRQVSLYSSALGFHLWHYFDSKSEEFLDKVSVLNRALHVDCQKRFPVSQTNSMLSGCRLWSRLEHGSRTWNDCRLTGNVR